MLQKKKTGGKSARLAFSENNQKILPSLHNFYQDTIKYRGQSKTSA